MIYKLSKLAIQQKQFNSLTEMFDTVMKDDKRSTGLNGQKIAIEPSKAHIMELEEVTQPKNGIKRELNDYLYKTPHWLK